MTKKLTLLLFIGLTWGQDNLKKESDFDKLVSKSGTIYLGEYSRIDNSVVYFKTTNAMASQGFPLNKIQILQLKDGTTIINDGEINKIDLDNIEDRKLIVTKSKKLTLEQKVLLLGASVAIVTIYLYLNFSFGGDFYFGP
tara:strand:- start:2297 stop:2716 length:420 start_codon:yes stop_codon:yes gene_type:complete